MKTIKTISSQRYLDDKIVEQKRSANDYVVTVTEPLEYDDGIYQVVVDGHHSLAAAKLDGVPPEYVEVCGDAMRTHQSIIRRGGADALLQELWIGDDYYDVSTGSVEW